MKKVLFSLVIVCIAALTSNAVYGQTEMQSATLQQGDKTSVFYGPNAFVDAFNAVKEKTDIITLSSGSFRSTTLNKSCKIYGAGCEYDNEKKIFPTSIDNMNVVHGTEQNPDDGTIVDKVGDLDDLYIEGCYISVLHFGTGDKHLIISDLTIKRCKFDRIAFHSYGNANTTNAKIINCIIPGDLFMDLDANNFSVLNSIIGNIWTKNKTTCLIKNCILFSDSSNLPICTYKDNIFLGSSYEVSSSAYFENNICRDANYLNGSPISNNINNWMGKNDIAIFGEEVGNAYDPTKSYAIKPEAASTYIGTDGTPVGLYGGYHPFTKTPSTPQIISKEIEVKSTVEGKLKVSIKVEAQE